MTLLRRRTREEETKLLRVLFDGPAHVVLHDARILVAVITRSTGDRATFFTSDAKDVTVSYAEIVSAHPCTDGPERDALLAAMSGAGML